MILADDRFRRVEPVLVLNDVIRVICEMLSVRAMTAEGTPAAEIGATFKPALHEYRVGLYQKSAARRTVEELQATVAACAEADTALKLSPQGYLVLERLICREG